MSKKKKSAPVVSPKPNVKQERVQAPIIPWLIPFRDFRIQALLLALIGFGFYYNSFEGEYALDDGIVIEQNEYVQQGFSGISKILSKDAYDSFYKQMGSTQQLSGGRYRPLSIVTFAIEQELLTDSTAENGYQVASKALQSSVTEDYKMHMAHIRHVVNVILYVLSVIVLLYFLREYIFKASSDMAFLTALLFVAHPIHSEVIANVKSRDEILSFLFIILTLIFAFSYIDKKKTVYLVVSLLCYFLALLSKEYAIVLVVLIPVAFYVFRKTTVKASFIHMLPYLTIFIIYAVMRFNIIAAGQYETVMKDSNFLCQNSGIQDKPRWYQNYKIATQKIDNPEVLNNPYIFAKKSYNVVDVKKSSGCVVKEKKFNLKLFLTSEVFPTEISTVKNYFMLLVFPHPLSSDYSYNQISYKNFAHYTVWLSLALHISLIVLCWKYLKKRHLLGFAILTYLIFLSMIGNILMDIGATMGERLIYHSSLGFCMAVAWFTVKGFERMKGSLLLKRTVILGLLAGLVTLYGFKCHERSADWKSDITLFTKDVETVPNSVLANGNAGARCIDMADMPDNKDKRDEYLQKAVGYLNKALSIHPKYVNGYLNLGLANYKLKNLEQSEAAWMQAKKLFPSNPYLKQFLPLLAGEFLNRGFKRAQEKDFVGALTDMEKATRMDPNNFMNYYHLGGAYYTLQQFDKARESWNKCLQLNPKYEEARNGIAALPPPSMQGK